VGSTDHKTYKTHCKAVPLPCRSLIMIVSFPLDLHSAVVFDSHMPCRSHIVRLLCHDHAILKATSQGHGTARYENGMGTARYLWFTSIGRPETACRRPARVRLLPATTRSSTKVVTRNRLAVRIFPSTTRNFTKDTVLSENGRVAAWNVWINTAGERHRMCELA
jgi:hypothetical protein